MYRSSRNKALQASASMAIIQGLAADGGLFVPSRIPSIDITDRAYLDKSYKELAKEILALYLDDFSEEEIDFCVERAYTDKFETDEIVPVKKAGAYSFIELFHGRTLAFKDLALSILPFLILTAKQKNRIQEDILIMTATSGDTGKAALEAFKDIEGIKIAVYYPDNGVSDMQKHQMTTQKGENLRVYAISGNFDDAQSAVKKAFTSEAFQSEIRKKGYLLSSANSINIGRLVPQIVYYFSSYFKLVKQSQIALGEKINICVPTGNFGNILAAYYAQKMGLPVNRLVSASNQNKVLADFFTTGGVYDTRREFYTTGSPSMDILISSNLERLLYHASEGNDALVKEKMLDLKEKGHYQVNAEAMPETDLFAGDFAIEEDCKRAIKTLFEEAGYLIDPHTAVAVEAYEKYNRERGEEYPVLIASTASPFKFPAFVLDALGVKVGEDENPFDTLRKLESVSGLTIPVALSGSEHFERRFAEVIDAKDLEESVFRFLEESK